MEQPNTTPPVSVMPDQPQAAPAEFFPEMASFWRRFGAAFLDGLILFVLSFLVGSLVQDPFTAQGLSYVVAFIFLGYFLTTSGQTPGKKAVGIKVLKSDSGQLMSWFDVFLREIFGKFVSSLVFLMGYSWFFLSGTRQTWHDSIASTYVIRLDEQNNPRPAPVKPYPKKVGLFILSLLPISLTFLIAFTVGVLSAINPAEQIRRGQSASIESSEGSLLDIDAPVTLDSVTALSTAITQVREQNELPEITLTGQLCAYASKRLEDIDARGEYDMAQGLYADSGDPASRGFFAGYENVGELYAEVQSGAFLAQSWFMPESNLVNPHYTEGCLQFNEEHAVFILAEPS